MRCVDARTRFADLHDAACPAAVRRPVETHLAACPACAEEWAWTEALLGDLALLNQAEPPAVDVADRVMARVALLPVPTSSRAVMGSAWPWAAAAAVGVLILLAATGVAFGPAWVAETARLGGRLVAAAAATLPAWLSTAKALLGAARAMLPSPALVERVQPILLGTAYFLCAAVFTASLVVAGREWRAARRRTGAGS